MRRVVIAALVLFVVGCGSTAPTPAPQTAPQTEHGVASWYGQEFAGRTTANGEIFDPLLLTAAHRSLPFGTIVDVRNPKTSQSVRVRINDRGPYIGNRVIDLSYAAAQQISLVEPGSGDIEMTVVRLGKGEHEPPVPFSVTISNDTPAPQQVAAAPPQTVAPAPAPVPQPAVVDRVQVENRKQVSPSGKSVEIVPLPQPTAPTSVSARQPAATQPPSLAPQPVPAATASGTPAAATTAASNVRGTQPAPVPAPAPVPTHVTTMPAPAPVAITSRAPAPAPAPVTPAPAPAPAPATSTRTTASTPAPAPAPTTPAATPAGRYVVQVGAFSVEENAKILQTRLTKIGLDSHVDHGSLYFVRCGPYATRDEAVQVRAKLENAGISAIVTKP